jgi:peptide/nickel transport system permease protein
VSAFGAFLLRRLVRLVLVLLAIATLLFFMLRLSGDPAAVIAGPNASPETIASISHAMGFDRPLLIQYTSFIGDVALLRFGDSLMSRREAMGLVLERLPATVTLVLAGFALALVVGLPIGILAGARRNSAGAFAALTVALLGQSIPVFWLGILLILVFAVNLHWLPSVGGGDVQHLVLPSVTLALLLLAKIVRLVRSGLLDVLGQDYVRTARAKGLGQARVVLRHALRNALIPIVTVVGVDLGQSLGGAVITETIFSWPGVGRLMIQAVAGRDYPVVQATAFVVAVLVVGINFGVDLVYRVVDPRVRLE